MSCRLNLYGWSLQEFKHVIGSGNAKVLDAASGRLSGLFKDPHVSQQLAPALAWARTLILDGRPFRDQLPPLQLPEDGGLLKMQLETETHISVIDAVKNAISKPEHLNFVVESSSYVHQNIEMLRSELHAIRITVPREYWSWMFRLNHGTPLFGDDFRTSWSRYVIFENAELPAMIQFFRAAAEYARVLPEGFPEQARQRTPTALQPSGKQFVTELAGWFEQIHQAG